MAIGFDNAVYLGQTASSVSPTQTTSYTATGSNIALVVWCGTSDVTSDDITGVTWGGVALTRVNRQAFFAGVGNDLSMYVLFGAAAGTANIVISATSTGSVFIISAAASYTGVGNSVDASTTNNAIGITSYATSLNTVADNCWTTEGAFSNTTANHSAGTGTTMRFGNSQNGIGVYDTNAVVTPAGNSTLNINITSGVQTIMSNMISLPPLVSATTSVVHNFSLLGVGT